MDFGEAGRDGATAGIGEEKAGGGGEISVETLEEPEQGHDEDELDDPMVADAVFEGDGGGEAFAEKRLPGGDIADGQNAESVEKSADP